MTIILKVQKKMLSIPKRTVMNGRYEVIGVPDKNKDRDNLAVLLIRDRLNGR